MKTIVQHKSFFGSGENGAPDCLLPSLEIARALLANIADPIMLGDAETTRFVYANQAAEIMLGRPAAEILEMTIAEVHPGEIREQAMEQFASTLASDLRLVSDAPIVNKSGEVTHYDIHVSPLEIAGKNYVIGTFRDVTDRGAAEKKAKDVENRFELAIKALPMGLHVYRLEKDGPLIFAGSNPAAGEILGVNHDEFMGRTIEDAFPPLLKTSIPETYRGIAERGGLWRDVQVEYEDDRIQGAFEVVAFQLKPMEMGVLFWDVTEKLKAEEEMRRLMAAMNGMHESVVITDPKGRISYANPCFEKLMGYSLDEVRGQPIGMYKSGKHDQAFYDSMWEVLGRGDTWTGNFINKRKDGSLFEEYASITPVHNSDGKLVHFVAVKRDMTHERDLERRVVRSQKMAALGQFAHRIAHDVTNSLTTIMGSAELLARGTDAEANKELSEGIANSVERIAGLTGDLMAFASSGKMSMKECNLDSVLRGIDEILHRSGGPAVTVNTDVRDKCRVRIDIAQIEQVVMHLLVNACEAMDGPGTIDISVSRGEMQDPDGIKDPLSDQLSIPAGILEFKDTGSGMDDAQCDKAFEPFFTTKKDLRRHAGLGLATVYGIIARHEGDVSVKSVKGEGTTVTISLPLVQ